MSKRNHVYLAGKMEQCDPKAMLTWRLTAADMFERAGIPVLDPTRRGLLHDRFDDANVRNRIVQQDLEDISRSKVLLCNLQDSIPGKGWGTVAEMALAQRDRRVIITLMDEGHFKHPFIYNFSTEIYTDLEEAVDAAISYF